MKSNVVKKVFLIEHYQGKKCFLIWRSFFIPHLETKEPIAMDHIAYASLAGYLTTL